MKPADGTPFLSGLSFSVPRGTEKIAGFLFAMRAQFPGWHYVLVVSNNEKIMGVISSCIKEKMFIIGPKFFRNGSQYYTIQLKSLTSWVVFYEQ